MKAGLATWRTDCKAVQHRATETRNGRSQAPFIVLQSEGVLTQTLAALSVPRAVIIPAPHLSGRSSAIMDPLSFGSVTDHIAKRLMVL